MIVPRYFLQCLLLAVLATSSRGLVSQQPLLSPDGIQDIHSIEAHQSASLHPNDVNDPRYDSLFALHRDLVNVNSISGHEHEVGVFLEQYLKGLNYTVERQNVDPFFKSCSTGGSARLPQRFNLLAHPPGHRQTSTLLTTHIDTVPPFYPYSLRSETEIWGRGTVDAKACVITQLYAAQSLLRASAIPEDFVSHLFVVGEEVSGDGMVAANDLGLKWDTVIFGEPTELKLASGHKGILIFRVKAHGKAAHSGYPWVGQSATATLIHALVALEKMEMPSSEKYGNSTLNIGLMQGGVAANVVAENATADIGIRIAEGSADALKKVVIDTVKAVDEKIEVHFLSRGYGPFDIDHDVPGFDSMTVNYGTDIPNLHGSHKRYLYGPGSILVAHSDHEHLSKQDLVDAVEGYEKLILHTFNSMK